MFSSDEFNLFEDLKNKIFGNFMDEIVSLVDAIKSFFLDNELIPIEYARTKSKRAKQQYSQSIYIPISKRNLPYQRRTYHQV